jgi:hypothetical protein
MHGGMLVGKMLRVPGAAPLEIGGKKLEEDYGGIPGVRSSKLRLVTSYILLIKVRVTG